MFDFMIMMRRIATEMPLICNKMLNTNEQRNSERARIEEYYTQQFDHKFYRNVVSGGKQNQAGNSFA